MLNGRLLLAEELPAISVQKVRCLNRQAKASSYINVQRLQGIQWVDGHWMCQRCGSICDDAVLPLGIRYCEHCLQYHRVTEHSWLYTQPWHSPFHPQKKSLLHWNGKLSPFQQTISDQLCADYSKHRTFLIWAVTGAGKTEMIYALLNQLIQSGQHIAYVAPRIDVVKELAERFRSVFSTLTIPCLHGGSQDTYTLEPFTVLTIQQLIRFRHCFDAIFIDEVDAYPYTDDPMLAHFVNQALQKDGRKIYLTATLTKNLQQQRQEEHWRVYELPVRYHLQPLPVPSYQWLFRSYRYLQRQRLPYVVKKLLRKRARRVLFFFPNIQQMKEWLLLLKHFDKELQLASVSSLDEQRDEKVAAMHAGKYAILLTTMILERGVTFPNIDIWIMDAHHTSFTKQALIQISGRAGRKQDYPTGEVVWLAEGWSQAMKEALTEIKHQNQQAQVLLKHTKYAKEC